MAKRFLIEGNTLDGKMTYQRDTAADALAVAEGAKVSLGVTITDSDTGERYGAEEFAKRFAH